MYRTASQRPLRMNKNYRGILIKIWFKMTINIQYFKQYELILYKFSVYPLCLSV
jgi:hypothetical protein